MPTDRDLDLRDALEALRRPLTFAARDNFADLDKVTNLGKSLAGAAARLAPLLSGERGKALNAWGEGLVGWDASTRSDKEKWIARGMRLVATCALDLAEKGVGMGGEKKKPGSGSGSGSGSQVGLEGELVGLPGIGPRTAERLAAKGIRTRGDLLHFIPRRWDDLRTLTPVRDLEPGVAQITRATVLGARVMFGRRRFMEVTFEGEDGGVLRALWFYFRGNMKERYQRGARFLIAGTPRENARGMQMAHPETTLLDEGDGEEHAGVVRARYPEIEGVPARTLARLARDLAERSAAEVPDGIPPPLRTRRDLASQAEALRELHLADAPGSVELAPDAVERLNAGETRAHRRLAYDELFFLQLGLARRRAEARAADAVACPTDRAALDRFLTALPFRATGAQLRAIQEISADLAAPRPMHRLLQGDVGSGKTLVAFAAATQAMAAGMQVAVMAPTELLAEQHARTLAEWARQTGRSAALLTASTPKGARESTLTLLAAGRLDLLIGTHALLAERVGFHRLGLVIIDEQHRFGVAQRATLRDKGGAPHLLVMTATPIPRTLALTAYGDLDCTILDELPPGRTPAETRVLSGARGRADAWKSLRARIEAGQQAYVVCPLVEESEKLEVADAVATFERLTAALPGVAVGLVHGRLSAAERDDVMNRFRSGEVRLLVATTVVEVGVDVPAAQAMVIEGAERFGLAQLHQLRGRIGRAPGAKPLCLLLTESSRTSDATRRLDVMARSTDGFVIADEDLKIRGPGELYGTRQAGIPRLQFANLARDLDLLRLARADAFDLLDADPTLSKPDHRVTRSVLDSRWAAGRLFAEEAG